MREIGRSRPAHFARRWPRNGKPHRFDPAGFPCFRPEGLKHAMTLAARPRSASPFLGDSGSRLQKPVDKSARAGARFARARDAARLLRLSGRALPVRPNSSRTRGVNLVNFGHLDTRRARSRLHSGCILNGRLAAGSRRPTSSGGRWRRSTRTGRAIAGRRKRSAGASATGRRPSGDCSTRCSNGWDGLTAMPCATRMVHSGAIRVTVTKFP